MTSVPRTKLLHILRFIVLSALGCAMLFGGARTAAYLLAHPRKPEQQPPQKEVPQVDVSLARASTEQVVVRAMGTVKPAVDVVLMPEVAGKILKKHPELIEGGVVREGDVLVEIDARDYQLILAAAEAQVETAKANLKLEEGQQDVAQHEWELLKVENATERERELALRKPYLEQQEAALKAAQTQLAQARLSIERTYVKAPFNAMILSADTDVGDVATTQTQLARLVGTDTYWILAKVALDELQWLQLPSPSAADSEVIISSKNGQERRGRVLKLLGGLEENGRLAQILIEVTDPLAIDPSNAGKQPLLLGEYVQTAILGKTVDGVFAIDRTALRDGSGVWIADVNQCLDIQHPEIVWSGAHEVFVRGLEDGARIVTSALATPVQGMAIKPSTLSAAVGAPPDPRAGEVPGEAVDMAHSEAHVAGRATVESE